MDNNSAVKHAIKYSGNVDLASNAPTAYWSSVRGEHESARTSKQEAKTASVKPTLAAVWPV
jgi:hypothetical protein